jgi:hypothetical protein
MAKRATKVTTVTGTKVKTGRKVTKRVLSSIGRPGRDGVKSTKKKVDEVIPAVKKSTRTGTGGVPNLRAGTSRAKSGLTTTNVGGGAKSPLTRGSGGGVSLRGGTRGGQRRDRKGRFA